MSEEREICVPEWIQMEIAEREAEERRARRWEIAKVALLIAGFAVGARALLALAS